MFGFLKKNKKRIRVTIRLFVFLCVVSVIGSMVYGVVLQIYTDNPTVLGSVNIMKVITFFALPALTAFSVSNNHFTSRYLILTVCFLTAFTIYKERDFFEPAVLAWILIPFLTAGSIWWMLFRTKSKVYYAVVSNKELSIELESRVDDLLKPSKLEEKLFKNSDAISNILEMMVNAIFLIPVLIFVLAILMIITAPFF